MEKKEKRSELKNVYEGKLWFNNSNTLLIKIPKELVEHKDFPLKNERTIAIIPLEKGLAIKNLVIDHDC